jgi:ferrous iron transport protein B
MLMGIYLIGIATAFFLSLLLRKTLLRGEEAPFVMELPPYRFPTLRSVLHRVKTSALLYLKKAGTIILAISVLMWVLTRYPRFEESTSDVVASEETDPEDRFRKMEYSIAGRIGKFIEPVIAPLGFDWKIGVGIIGAFTAKEVFVAQMGVIYSLGETDETDETLRSALARDYSSLTGFSLMLFLLIAAPCMATVAITRKESGHWKWAALQFFGLTAVAWILSLIVYQLGSIFV